MSRKTRVVTRVPKGDGWSNATTGLGQYGRDKSLNTSFCLDHVPQEQAEEMWQGDDIIARVVETVPNEMLRASFEIKVEGDEQLTEDMEQRARDLNLEEILREALYYQRAYGGAGILPTVNDGAQALDSPLVPEKIYSLDALSVFTPRELAPQKYYTDFAHYGQISQYGFYPLWVPPGATTPMEYIDASRIIRAEGIAVSKRKMLAGPGRGWGDSILGRLGRIVAQFQQGWQGAGILLQDFAPPVLKVDNLHQILSSSQPGDQSLAKRAAAIELCRSLARVVIIGKNEEYSRQAVPLTGMADMLDKLALRLAAASNMPVSLLMGQSPAGLNATGDADVRWFYDQVASLQRRVLLPILRPIVRLMFLDKLNGPGREPENWNIVFKPLWQMTAKEEADRRYVVAQADQIYVATGVLDARMVAESRFGGDEYSADTHIDMADWEKMATEADAEQAKADQQAHEQQLALMQSKKGDSDDQPRDDIGQWASTGGGSAAISVRDAQQKLANMETEVSTSAFIPETTATTEDALFGEQGVLDGPRLTEIARKWDDAPIEKISIASLQQHQETVSKAGVEKYLNDPHQSGDKTDLFGNGDEKDASVPVVLRMGNTLVLQDGNHRAVAATLRGIKELRARVIDIKPYTEKDVIAFRAKGIIK